MLPKRYLYLQHLFGLHIVIQIHSLSTLRQLGDIFIDGDEKRALMANLGDDMHSKKSFRFVCVLFVSANLIICFKAERFLQKCVVKRNRKQETKKPFTPLGVKGFCTGGDREIRTLEAGFCPLTFLAGKHLRPLGHVSNFSAESIVRGIAQRCKHAFI